MIDIVFTYLIFWIQLTVIWLDHSLVDLIFSSITWSFLHFTGLILDLSSIDIFFPGLMRCTSRWLHSQGAVVCWRQYCLLYLVVSVHSTVSSSCQDLQVIINGQDNYLSVFLLVSILQQALLIFRLTETKTDKIYMSDNYGHDNNYYSVFFILVSLFYS